jgi:hypothetical protein
VVHESYILRHPQQLKWHPLLMTLERVMRDVLE